MANSLMCFTKNDLNCKVNVMCFTQMNGIVKATSCDQQLCVRNRCNSVYANNTL